jgi:hypothetical protein
MLLPAILNALRVSDHISGPYPTLGDPNHSLSLYFSETLTISMIIIRMIDAFYSRRTTKSL